MDLFIARIQAWLTFLIVGTWVALMLLWAVGYDGAGEAADRMKEVVMLAVGFWLLRPRATLSVEPAKPDEPPDPAAKPRSTPAIEVEEFPL